MDKLVSVLIPVYNVEKYVYQAVQSIQNQTYKNLEIIIVDDCSLDNTFNIVKKMADLDSRIKLYKNNTNLKISKTLNYAFEKSTGFYIARMDGDDISDENRIMNKVKFLESNPKYDLVGCSLIAIDTFGNIIGQSKCSSNESFLIKMIKYRSPVSHIWVAKRAVYTALNGYRDMPGVEDYDFLLRMLTSNLRFTNLEYDFNYFVRLGREGNSISTLGLKQLKMHQYAYSLYLLRLSEKEDNFDINKYHKFIETNQLSLNVHKLSSRFLYKAIKLKGKKRLFASFLYLLLSAISPWQVRYYYGRLKGLLILKFGF